MKDEIKLILLSVVSDKTEEEKILIAMVIIILEGEKN